MTTPRRRATFADATPLTFARSKSFFLRTHMLLNECGKTHKRHRPANPPAQTLPERRGGHHHTGTTDLTAGRADELDLTTQDAVANAAASSSWRTRPGGRRRQRRATLHHGPTPPAKAVAVSTRTPAREPPQPRLELDIVITLNIDGT